MPKAITPKNSKRSTQLLVLAPSDGSVRAKLIPRPTTYLDAINLVRKHFWICPGYVVALETDELEICSGEMLEITEDVWEVVKDDLGKLYFDERQVEHKGDQEEEIDFNASKDRTSQSSTSVVQHVLQKPSFDPYKRPQIVNPAQRPEGIEIIYYNGSKTRSCIVHAQSSDKIKVIKPQIERQLGLPADDQRLLYGLGRLCEDLTFSHYGIDPREATIDLMKAQIAGKPVIYLFSPRVIEARIRLGLVRDWEFSAVYPIVPIERGLLALPGEVHQSLEWITETRRDGFMLEKTSGLEVAYLFWEAHTSINRAISPPPSPREPTRLSFSPTDARLSPQDSVLLSIEDLPRYLDKALNTLSLHTEARTSFITYWLPSFMNHKHIALRFVPQNEYEKAAPLDITPAPDVVTRVFMPFRGVEPEDLGEWREAVDRAATDDTTFWRNIVGIDVGKSSDGALFRVGWRFINPLAGSRFPSLSCLLHQDADLLMDAGLH